MDRMKRQGSERTDIDRNKKSIGREGHQRRGLLTTKAQQTHDSSVCASVCVSVSVCARLPSFLLFSFSVVSLPSVVPLGGVRVYPAWPLSCHGRSGVCSSLPWQPTDAMAHLLSIRIGSVARQL